MTYDQWKTTDPSQEGPVCEVCFGWLYDDRHGVLFCEECESELEQRQQAFDNQPDPLDILE